MTRWERRDPRGPEQGGGGLRTFGPVRAPALADGRLGRLRRPPARVRCNGFVKRSAGPPGSRPGRLPRKAKVTTRGGLGIPATFAVSWHFTLVDPIPWIDSMESILQVSKRSFGQRSQSDPGWTPEFLKGRKSARHRSPESPARHADRTSEEKPVHEPLRPRCRRGRRGAASACTDGRPGLRRGGRGVHAERACLVDDGERNGAGCGGRSARHAVARCSAAAGSSSVMTLTVEEFPESQPTSAARTPTAMISPWHGGDRQRRPARLLQTASTQEAARRAAPDVDTLPRPAGPARLPESARGRTYPGERERGRRQ